MAGEHLFGLYAADARQPVCGKGRHGEREERRVSKIPNEERTRGREGCRTRRYGRLDHPGTVRTRRQGVLCGRSNPNVGTRRLSVKPIQVINIALLVLVVEEIIALCWRIYSDIKQHSLLKRDDFFFSERQRLIEQRDAAVKMAEAWQKSFMDQRQEKTTTVSVGSPGSCGSVGPGRSTSGVVVTKRKEK